MTRINENLGTRIALWAVGDDTGLSSKFLAACALRKPDMAEFFWPLDSGDFGRCFRLMQLLTITERIDALKIAADYSEHWKAIATNWDKLAELYEKEKNAELYALMEKIGL